MKIEKVTRSMVKRRYFPKSGTARDVGGIISAKSKKNTVNESRIEIQRVTCNKFIKQLQKVHNSLEDYI